MSVQGVLIEVAGQEAYLVQPEGPSKGGVVILPTYGGVNAFAIDYANTVAQAGLHALVWNPYPTQGIIPAETAMEFAKTLTDEQSLRELSLCIDYLLKEVGVEKIGIVGFCLGGRTALLLPVHDKRVQVCACVYPTITIPPRPNFIQDPVALAADIDCPVQLTYPGKDVTTVHEVFEKLQTVLQARPRHETQVNYFPEATHGFMHNRSEANDFASGIARPHTLHFLRRYLLF